MFIGYEIKSQQNQAKPMVLEADIKLSQAVLDPTKGAKKTPEPVSLVVEYNKKQFILAVLDPARSWQCPLDLMFAAGSEVKFFLRGSGSVHLTGFECHDDISSDLAFDSSSEEEVEEEEEAEKPKPAANKRAAKAVASPKTNGVGKVAKKEDAKKPAAGPKADSDEDEDDSDDEDFDSDMMDQDDDIEMSDEEDDDEDDLDEEDLEDEEEDE